MSLTKTADRYESKRLPEGCTELMLHNAVIVRTITAKCTTKKYSVQNG